MIEPETIRQLFPDADEPEFNKMMAQYVIEHTNAPFEDFYIFNNVILALNGVVPDPNTLAVPEIPWIWKGLIEFSRLRPKMELSDEVQKYIKIVSDEAGYYVYPPACTDLVSKYKNKAEALAQNGPFPLGESVEEIQAAKLLEISLYLNNGDVT